MKLGFFTVNFSEKSLEEVVKLVSQIMEEKKSNTEQSILSGSPSYEHGDVFVREKLVPYKIQNILEKLPETIPVLSYPSLYRRCRSSGF